MKVHAHFQQKNAGDATHQWIQARLGVVTASEFTRFVKNDGTHRTGEMPHTYMCDKLFERWTGRQKSSQFFSQAVNNGIIVEDKARAFAGMEYGLEIVPVGFISSDDGRFGASPDGLIGWGTLLKDKPTDFGEFVGSGESGIEIKCPELATHIKYLLGGELPPDYFCQVQGSMFVTHCQTWHFLSYPLACYMDGFPPFHLVVNRDEGFCANLAASLKKFLAAYDAAFDELCEINGGPPPPRQQFIQYQDDSNCQKNDVIP